MGLPARTCGQSGQGNWTLALLLRTALVLCFIPACLSEPVSLPFLTCAPSTVTEPNPLKRINVTSVYGQIYHPNDPNTRELKLTAFGDVGNTLEGYSNTTGYLGESKSGVTAAQPSTHPRAFHSIYLAEGPICYFLKHGMCQDRSGSSALAKNSTLTLFYLYSDSFHDYKLLDLLCLWRYFCIM
jgi:hypothetical protein